LRTFGGPLRLHSGITYIKDEETVGYIQRAKSVLVGKLLLPILILFLLLLGLIMSTAYFTFLEIYIAIAILIWLFMIAYIIINYLDDVYILTNKRVIDINRQFLIFDAEHLSIAYGQIEGIQVLVGNRLYEALNVGKVIIETPGTNPNLVMRVVDDPFSIRDMIAALKESKEKKSEL